MKTFLQDFLKMSWRCLGKTSWKRLEGVLKMYDQDENIGLDQDVLKTKYVFKTFSVCNFQSMKTPVELNSLLSKFFCYITWFVISPDETRPWTTCKRGLYVKPYCFFAIVEWFKNYKLFSSRRRFAGRGPNPFCFFRKKTSDRFEPWVKCLVWSAILRTSK